MWKSVILLSVIFSLIAAIEPIGPHLVQLTTFGVEGHGTGEFEQPYQCVMISGELFVSDQWNHRILVFSSDGDYLRAFGKKGNGPGELMFPSGLAVSHQGELYVVDSFNGRVVVFSPSDGTQLRVFGVLGDNTSLEMKYPMGIQVLANRVVVGDFVNDHAYVYTPAGQLLFTIGGFTNLLGVAVYDNVLYTMDAAGVKTFTLQGVLLGTLPSIQGGIGLAVTEQYIYAGHGNAVRTFSHNGTLLSEVQPTGSKLLGLITVHKNMLLVTDKVTCRGWVFGTNETRVTPGGAKHVAEHMVLAALPEVMRFGEGGYGFGAFSYPFQVIPSPDDDTLYVSDQFNNRISLHSAATGEFRAYIGNGKGPEPGRLEFTMGIAITGEEIFVGDGVNRKIQVFNRHSGEFIRSFGGKGHYRELIDPMSVATDSEHAFVVDYGSEAVVMYTLGGEFVREWGSVGSLEGQFTDPFGIVVYRDNVHVADLGRVQTFSKNGTFLHQIVHDDLTNIRGVGLYNDLTFVSIGYQAGEVLVLNRQGEIVSRTQPRDGVKLGLLFVDDHCVYVADECGNHVFVFNNTYGLGC